jgi:poly(ribitol-phosphate) beta-N-acetylglucosaminyltransferase
MKISVIVPIGILGTNLSKLTKMVHESLEYGNQVILVNDIKDAQTPILLLDLCEQYSDSDLIYKSLECGNPGSARNIGLELATNSWIVFWDCDDIPNVLEFNRMVENAVKEKREIAIGRYEVFDERVREVVAYSELPKTPQELASNPGIWRFAFKASQFGTSRFPNLSMGEDQVFLSRLGLNFNEMYFHDKFVYTYCLHPDQLTANSIKRGEVFYALVLSAREFNSNSRFENLRKAFFLQQFLTTLRHSSVSQKLEATIIFFQLYKKGMISKDDLRSLLASKRVLRGGLT